MKLKFDSDLDFQKEAIQAVTDLFEGLPPKQGDFEVSFTTTSGAMGLEHTELGLGNQAMLEDEQLLKNLHEVQEQNTIPKSRFLRENGDTYTFPNFSVEMETGTGKTYVYLRTIFELNQKYGFKKFIIVVPSVAIREGVLSSIRIMKDHLAGLYNNTPFDSFVYDSRDLSKVRQFAVSNEIQIMIINIQAFQKDAGDIQDYSQLTEEQLKKLNIIHKEQDKMSGRKPIEFVQATKPIVIIDEPQSVDNTTRAKKAIKTLNPLFCLRYSATHINPYNLVYNLDPIQAYDRRLVKQIEVASVMAEESFNQAYIRLESIYYPKGSTYPQAKVTIHEDTPNGPKTKPVTLKQSTDLSQQTDRAGYEGYIVGEISAEPGYEYVEFTNGKVLKPGQEEGGMGEEVARSQIRQTIEQHLEKEKRFKDKGIKVLSLIFIDKVANYRSYNDSGEAQKGKLAEWFEEEYRQISTKPKFKGVLEYKPEDLHDGYFSADRRKGKIVQLKETGGNTKADEETYELIMRDKERLLSSAEPLRFIFSHSALKEGWDNPNVFQICSLREMGTERERRQTLGRGLRLPVNQEGERVFDETINRLTVIAGESFQEYAKGLQEDYERDCGVKFGRIEPIAFAKLIDEDTGQELGQDTSKLIWKALVDKEYLDGAGDITDKFVPEKDGFILELPSEFEPIRAAITDEMKRYLFKNRVVNARDRRKLTYNKRIELNEDFKTLWSKINYKTRYSVEFETEELIQRAVKKIQQMEKIKPVKILIDRTETEITEAGVEGGRVLSSKVELVRTHKVLPDILAFLQRETELTRGTLVEMLKRTGRLKEFAENPQSFMTETSKRIRRALHELVVDGIKYEQIQGQRYEMRLFEEKEIEEYLNRLYEIQHSDDQKPRSPYDYIPFDSTVEKEVAERLDSAEKVKFFCKLPRWFVIQTPLGDYNPDWAVVTGEDEKLYLVRETKSTHDEDKRRNIENQKIACGQAHFDALGVNFKVATGIHEVLMK